MFTWTLGLFCLLGLFLELGSSQTICPTGKYGVDCELNCNSNCLKNCHRVTGTCEEACVIGRYDSYCDKICNCTFGCDKETGFCPCDLHGCSTCNTGGTGCSSCDVTSYFVPSSNDGSKCCSRGCNTDGVGILDCDTNGVCALDDCIDGYWGDRCTICRELITNCEICESKQNTNDLICQQCLPGYIPSMDQSRCCPPGCDDCRGDICSVCKPGYYIYNEICDTCGDFCQPPGNGTARCNPVTGECHYGCLDGWHGLKCDVQCTLPDCEICDFKESDRLLTCKTCVEGWAPNEFTGLCQTCNVNCVNSQCDSTTGYCTEGCMPGWRSDRCDQTCEDADMGNCTICGRDSFTCSECMFDFWGATCEYICSQNCVPVVNGHVCDKDDAACMSGCMPGYWREDCNRECPNCLNDVCQIADGVCQDQACKPGYWGPDCMRPCSTYCADNPATGDFECQFETGICTHGCKYNQYGVLCDMTCSSHCLDNRTTTVNPFDEEPLCSQLDGDCKYGCEDYYYKSNCSDPCSSTCVTQQCDRNAGYCLACLEVPKGWLCYDGIGSLATPADQNAGCPAGKHGTLCQANCTGGAYCLNEVCLRHTGHCAECVPGRWGNDCNFECPTCSDGRCHQQNGTCTYGCLDGFYGDKCDKSCHDRCSVCERDNGACITCNTGLYGIICEQNCSMNCLPSYNDTITCNIETGHCDAGVCKSGFYSLTCKSSCSSNCAENDIGETDCDINTGGCEYGCDIGWFGDLCTGECRDSCRNKNCFDESDNCVEGCSDFYYGERCATLCNQFCTNHICDDYGYCTDGCLDGQFGDLCNATCDEMCIDNTCDRISGRCEYCLNSNSDTYFLCETASCPVGKYGDYCNTTCPGGDRCLDNLCDRNTAACEGCINNFWGENCQNNCSTCVDGLCNQETGICVIACVDGYFGTQCRDKCSVRCDVCSRADGSCLICSNGTWGPVCENKCSANCTLIDGDLLLCDKATGACSSGECVSGSFGLSCDRECYEHCYAVEEVATCEYETGYCSDGCEIGWYGSLCTGECSLKCRNKNCFDDSNICLDGCADDYYGDRCLYLCNSGCNLGICDDLGYCKAGCIKNRFGDMCSETCNTTCTDDMCDRQSGHCAECSKQDPDILCRTALCDPGRYGLLCNFSCPSPACLDNRCKRDGGDCDGCITGRYGLLCEEQCNTCNNGNCTQPTGICLEGCIAGWYGDRCENRCDSCVTCRQNSGICTECSAGTYGISCENNCSANCQPAKDDIKSCNVYTGACDSFACLPGYYGADCVMPCHTNCGPDDSGQVMCDFINGACLADCTKGFFGVHCERACDSRCHDQTCDRGRGICADCELVPRPPNCPDANCTVTMYGQYCNLTCPVGCERACQRYTSACANCKPGFYLPQCNQTCDYPGCYRCAQKTGKCESCKPGKYGINCDKNCGDCQPIDGEVICDMMTGDCLSDVCQAGRWGLDCTLVCNPNCADENGRDICHKFTGVCELGCDISHFGDFCEGNCSSRCKNSNCKDSVNNCQEGCERGYYGLNSCQTPCSGTCINRNCRETDGFCTEGCIDGFYKERCSKACNSTCINDKCDRVTGHCPECSQTTENPYYFCRAAECNATFQGTLCDQPCPENCAEECERYTGKCKGCDPYFWFDNCTRTCTNCLQGLCDQVTGICSQGCNPGYFDPFCSTPCVFTGCETCSRQTGLCITCKDEFYGDACEKSCSPQCTPTKDGLHLCDKASGTCQTGSCLSGSWDLDCHQTCNINCKTDSFGDRTCYYQSGNCSNGCEDKFWDDHCDKPCSHTCLYDLCKRDATCLLGCVDETYGAACEWPCEETCNDNTCDRVTGYCAECNKTLEEQSELCRTAACPVEGTSGLYCNMTCPENCESGCDRNNRKCDFCKASLWGDNCTDTCGNCADSRCFQNNGTCTDACEVGFWGDMCLDLCKHDGCLACERMDGECSICLPNLWGFSCNITCSPACPPSDDDNEIYCNKLTGDCDLGTCALGFYGTDCTKECSPYCVSKVCDFEKGICSIGCLKGWKNNFCNQTCSQTCVQNECSRGGRCDIGCVEGFSGFDCTTPCGSTCINNKCDREQGVCLECLKEPVNEQDFTCRTADCVTGSRGLFCNETCPTNCNSTCHRYNSTCDGCLPGFYDDFCDVTCGNCVEDTCNQVTGTCDIGCQDGYHGDLCFDPCNHDGCMSCDRDLGECIVCLSGLFGYNCSESCSGACAASGDGNVTCNKDTGACTEGFCLPGWFSPNCDMPCPDNCQPSDDGRTFCKFADGSCDDGCLSGWFEPQCDVRCNSNCVDGICNRTGYCTGGCMDELFGYFCEENCSETCNDNACDRETGNCAECYVTEPTFECRDAACPPGSQGLMCDRPCPSNCFEDCHRYNSTCYGCDNGFYGDLCEDQCGNCIGGTCNQTTGYCADGCLDEWYGLPCEQRCPDDNCKTCSVLTGTCLECKPGYFGNNCEKICSSFCAPGKDNRIRCHRTSGFCNETRCKAGYFLEDCTRSCDGNCGQDFNNDRPCEILTGTCMYDCTSGWYGDTCNRQCSENCVDGLCNRDGFCISGCETGFYGGDCRLTCAQPLTCNDGTCHRYNGNCSACDEPAPTPVCRTADCNKGLWGLFCDNTCPANCQGGVCIRDTGLCQSCNPTWYSPTCDQRCFNCKDDVCLQSNGHCIRGCKDGFYTDKCDVPCLHDGCQDCTRDNGTCITCKVAKFNSNCSEDCSPQCETTGLGFRTCSKASGYCDAGECIDGYWSETCTEECSPFCGTDACDLISGRCDPCLVGYFGLTCKSICSPNCKNSNCQGTRDTCMEGCANGFWGTACEKQCNDNCVQNMCDINDGTCLQGCLGDEFYGSTCQEPCNSNCASGQCERNGYCIGLCKTGTYGDMCENACPVNAMCTDMTCDRMAGNCSECDAAVPGPLCPSAVCPSGKRGTDCQLDCTSSTCLYNRCTRDTDVCVGCNIGIQGTYCDKPCGNCKVGTGCGQLSGVCDEGCRDGYHGDECDQMCNSVCESCERDPPAKCVVCRENRWGSECQNTCSANCAKTVIGTLTYTRCEKDSGACSEGACTNNRYWSDDCSIQCPINCLADGSGYKTCRISDGTCSIGCDATFFGPQCTGKCSVQCKDQVCENSANNCIRGCADGFYNPPTCSSMCSANCLNPGRCNSVDGTCIGGCKDGYFGERCREACFGKCTDGTCDDQGGCPDCRLSPVGPLCHPQVCPSLKYGPSCESDCPGLYCLDGTCDRQSGKCPQGCLSWYHGEYCSERCICHTTGTVSCNQEGVCQCKVGWTSVDCSQTCSDGCRNSECEKNGQCTLGCIAGRYGSTCENRCSGCVNEDCDSATGECSGGCKSGYYGNRCDEDCPGECAACDSSARCTQCNSFLYGLPTCSQPCSVNCKPGSGRNCMESNGACVDGCNTGYWGSKCDKECGFCGGDGGCSSVNGICTEGCEVGYYNPTCTTTCSARCVIGAGSTKPECNIATGACTHDCVDGYYGNTCEECSNRCLKKKCFSLTNCTEGCEAGYYSKTTGCNLDCSRCKSGRCNDTGHCISGCEGGFYGPRCQTVCSKTCKDETCDQTTGECADCSKTPVGPLCKDEVVVTETEVERLSTAGIIGISAGCAVAVVIIVILLVVCVFYQRKASDAKHEIHLPSDMIDRLSTHRSHHSTISSQYPVARVVGDDEKDFVLF